ncbi:acyl carrier protein [Micromonospora sp. WMMD1102]|uniref:acyl carrier protein n=1 Tax=Micromonospora sp. WMMD1102 TaxID=3016105 RepID=UPI0024155144|nr:acyl carrier protein [Micromonospora sp. WMMD1102]MDG4785100.1 acyl carrier protein [Micromonospora sp. WMMD1102]
MEIRQRVLGFITARFPQAELTGSEDIFSLGFVNSLFAMELVMFVEKEFGISVPNDALKIDNFRTVDSITALVERQLSVTA